MKHFRLGPSLVAVLGLAGGLLWAQGMKKMDMNDMPYAKLKETMSNPQQQAMAMEMAKKNHVIVMGGRGVEGKPVTLKGELTGANCYLSMGLHGHKHALCAKACVSQGSPVVFLAENGKVYVVLTGKDGRPLPKEALNALGRPGVTVKGDLVKAHGIAALAVTAVE